MSSETHSNTPQILEQGDGIFGLAFTEDQSELVFIAVPWEATTSYGAGTSGGPEAILAASAQVDLYDIDLGDFIEKGAYLPDLSSSLWVKELNDQAQTKAQFVKNQLEIGSEFNLSPEAQQAQKFVNESSDRVNQWVYEQASLILKKGKKAALIGGDHSSPYGMIRAISEKYKQDFGILHIDAHADLRDAYQGFQHSHASIMNNVMSADFKPKKLVQVGIRDFCKEEKQLIDSRTDITTFFDRHLKVMSDDGTPWRKICEKIVSELPQNVYISFDIDGLSPEFCPNTGTPVPGGLSFDQALSLFAEVRRSGRKIIGFDLNEVAPGQDGSEWDANVGARILFKLSGYLLTEDLGVNSAEKLTENSPGTHSKSGTTSSTGGK